MLAYLAIIKNPATNIGVHVPFQISVFVYFGYISRCGIAGLYSSSIFSFLEASMLFSIMATPIYIPTDSVGGFPFLHILTIICYLSSFR